MGDWKTDTQDGPVHLHNSNNDDGNGAESEMQTRHATAVAAEDGESAVMMGIAGRDDDHDDDDEEGVVNALLSQLEESEEGSNDGGGSNDGDDDIGSGSDDSGNASVIHSRNMLLGSVFTLMTHTLFGLHPIFSRYLQRYADHPLPPMSIIVVSNGMVLVVYLFGKLLFTLIFRVVKTAVWSLRRRMGSQVKPRHKQQQQQQSYTVREYVELQWCWFRRCILGNWTLWLFQLCLIVRSVTNILSSRYTRATYATFIQLLTPFCVSMLTLLIHYMSTSPCGKGSGSGDSKPGNTNKLAATERPTLLTFLFMIAAALGGSLLIVAGGGSDVPPGPPSVGEFFSTNLHKFFEQLSTITWSDALGLSLAFISAFFLACYMVLLKIAQSPASGSDGSASKSLTQDQMFIVQTSVLTLGLVLPSVFFEDWTPYLKMGTNDVLMLLGFAFFVYMLANWLNIASVKLIGPTNNSTVLAWRLVSTILFSMIFLNDWIRNVWQLLGCVIVFASITLFMVYKRVQLQSARGGRSTKPVISPQENPSSVTVEPQRAASDSV